MAQATFRRREELGCCCRDLLHDTISKTRMRCFRRMLRRPCCCLEGFGVNFSVRTTPALLGLGFRVQSWVWVRCQPFECSWQTRRARCWFRLGIRTQRRRRCCARGGRHANGSRTSTAAAVLFRGNVDDRNVIVSEQNSTYPNAMALLRTPRSPHLFLGNVGIHCSY